MNLLVQAGIARNCASDSYRCVSARRACSGPRWACPPSADKKPKLAQERSRTRSLETQTAEGDLATRSCATSAAKSARMVDPLPRSWWFALQYKRVQLNLIHPVVPGGLTAHDCPRHAGAGDDGNGVAALADLVARHWNGLRYCCGCRRFAGVARPHAGMSSWQLCAVGAAQSLGGSLMGRMGGSLVPGSRSPAAELPCAHRETAALVGLDLHPGPRASRWRPEVGVNAHVPDRRGHGANSGDERIKRMNPDGRGSGSVSTESGDRSVNFNRAS